MKKRNKIVALFLAIVTVTGILGIAPLNTSAYVYHTQQEALNWTQAQTGKCIRGGQCAAFINAYYDYLVGYTVSGHAKDYVTNDLPSGWYRTNNPSPGDIVVWEAGAYMGKNDHYANAEFGHVGIVFSVNGGYMDYYDQNSYQYKKTVGIHYGHEVSSATTFIHPDFTVPPPPVPPTNVWFNIGNQNNIFTKDNSLTFWFGADNATNYYIGIDRNGERVLTQEVTYGITIPFYVSGYYTAYISAVNNYGYIDSQKVYFCVFDPRDIGDDFYASISTTDKSKRITSDNNGNVSIQASNDSDSQIWHFIKNSDRSYRIVNKVTQGDLNVTYGTSVYDRTVNAVTDNYDENTNLWYLRQRPNGFAISSKLNTCTTIDGSEEVLRNREANDSDVQTFCIDYIGMEPVKAKIYRNHIYEYFPLTTTWTKAEEICQLRGGHLATVSNSVENDFLYHFADEFDREYLWLGGIYNHNVGWNWVTAEEFSYTNWSTNQPDNNLNQEYYLNMYIKHPVQGAWNDMLEADEYDHRSFGFICERELTHTIGDSNQDNRITIHDVTAIQRAQAELEAFTIEQLAIADTNGDGVVNINDATHLQQYLAEFDVTLG